MERVLGELATEGYTQIHVLDETGQARQSVVGRQTLTRRRGSSVLAPRLVDAT